MRLAASRALTEGADALGQRVLLGGCDPDRVAALVSDEQDQRDVVLGHRALEHGDVVRRDERSGGAQHQHVLAA